MSTAAQVRKLLLPLVQEHLDLALLGREIIVLPVHHYTRGVYVDRTSSKGVIQPFWRVNILFSPPPHSTGWWNHLRGCGDVDDPRIIEMFRSDLSRCLDEVLRPTATIDDLRALPPLNGGRLDLRPIQELLIDIASGRHDGIRDRLSSYIAEEDASLARKREWIDVTFRRGGRYWRGEVETNASCQQQLAHMRQLLDLVSAGSWSSVADTLREWERWNATNTKIEELWKPTPFPFEA